MATRGGARGQFASAIRDAPSIDVTMSLRAALRASASTARMTFPPRYALTGERISELPRARAERAIEEAMERRATERRTMTAMAVTAARERTRALGRDRAKDAPRSARWRLSAREMVSVESGGAE